jgi:hypothetical protein
LELFSPSFWHDAIKGLLLSSKGSNTAKMTNSDVESLLAILDEWLSDNEVRKSIFGLFQQLVFDRYGIFSLSADRDNTLMWSHYACDHKGICIGFNTTMLGFACKSLFDRSLAKVGLLEVKYVREIPKIYPKSQLDVEFFKDIFRFKADNWKYEKEYRLISDQGGEGAMKKTLCLPCEAFSEILFGCKTNDETKKEILSSIENWGVKPSIFQCVKREGGFGTELYKVDLSGNQIT